MNGRGLTLVNAAGCLVLGLLLILQWRKEFALDEQMQELQASLVAARDQHAAARERAVMLETEQELLKQSIGSMQQAAEATGKLLTEREAQVTELTARIATLEAQIKVWQDAIVRRDTSIRTLNAELAACRRRLEEAITKLKAADTR